MRPDDPTIAERVADGTTRKARVVRCVIGTADLDGMVERGELADGDAEVVRTFAEWLAKSGPPSIPGQPRRKLTAEQRAFRLDAFRDPGWRAFLGITEQEARAAVEAAGEPWETDTSATSDPTG